MQMRRTGEKNTREIKDRGQYLRLEGSLFFRSSAQSAASGRRATTSSFHLSLVIILIVFPSSATV